MVLGFCFVGCFVERCRIDMEDSGFVGGGSGIHGASIHPDLNQFEDNSTGFLYFVSLLSALFIYLFSSERIRNSVFCCCFGSSFGDFVDLLSGSAFDFSFF